MLIDRSIPLLCYRRSCRSRRQISSVRIQAPLLPFVITLGLQSIFGGQHLQVILGKIGLVYIVLLMLMTVMLRKLSVGGIGCPSAEQSMMTGEAMGSSMSMKMTLELRAKW